MHSGTGYLHSLCERVIGKNREQGEGKNLHIEYVCLLFQQMSEKHWAKG
jgi:hypothetical protein